MAKKVKIPKKDVEFLPEDIELDEEVVTRLAEVQEKYRNDHQERLNKLRQEAKENYDNRIKVLTAAKSRAIENYDKEIEKYKSLADSLKEGGAGAVTTTTKKKIAVKKTVKKKVAKRKAKKG